MINVGLFLSRFPDEYPGGKNYIKNLFISLSRVENNNIHLVLFVGHKTPQIFVDEFKDFGEIVKTSLLDRKSLLWLINKMLLRLFHSHFITSWIMKKNNIDVLSHSDIYGKRLPFKTINWVPDIQFLHLPHLWTKKGLQIEKKRFRDRLEQSDLIIFSSYDGQKDGMSYVPHKSPNFKVVRPVYQVDATIYSKNHDAFDERVYNQFGIRGKFFYLPNQFWAHKNHQKVFEAINILKKKGLEVLVVCTGLMKNADSKTRNSANHIEKLNNFITENNLQENVKCLGLIDYEYVQYFMRNSISVLNPSFFEGWSSSVEECKSIGKSVILSNLNVHKEQDPPGGIFFDPNSASELSNILEAKWRGSIGGPELELERNARETLHERTLQFGREFLKAVQELLSTETHAVKI